MPFEKLRGIKIKFFTTIHIVLLVSLFGFVSCTKSSGEKQTCSASATLTWDTLRAGFLNIDDVSGLACFKLVVNPGNLCIYRNPDIYVRVYARTGYQIPRVSAIAIVPNTTVPNISMYQQGGSWFNDPYSLSLGQGFSSNPGNFQLWVLVYVPASTQAEAMQNYDLYISKIEINVLYSLP